MPKPGVAPPPIKQVERETTVLLDGCGVAAGVYRYPGPSEQTWHDHEETVIAFVVGGAVREGVGSRDRTAAAFDIGVKPSGLRHTDRFGAGGAVVVRLALDPAALSVFERLVPQTTAWTWRAIDEQQLQPWISLARVLRSPNPGHDLQGCISDALSSLTTDERIRPPQAAPRWLTLAREHLVDDALFRPRLGTLARDAGVHPVYFARQFRRFYGCSVGEFVRARQVRQAATQIATTDALIAAVACTTGFADQSHLSRIFRASTGITPSDYRTLSAFPDGTPMR